MTVRIHLSFCVPVGHLPGDYAKLFSNAGSGNISWVTPLNNEIYNLFPQGAGIYGYGMTPYGQTPYGRPFAMRTAGYGQLPYGIHPYGLGTAVIEAVHKVDECGVYKFAFGCYDRLGNSHEGTPEEKAVEVHLAPPAPAGLKKVSYDNDTQILILEAA